MGKGGFPGGGFGGGNMQQILKQAQKCKPICSALRKNLKFRSNRLGGGRHG